MKGGLEGRGEGTGELRGWERREERGRKNTERER
jgi:hypothetical protein